MPNRPDAQTVPTPSPHAEPSRAHVPAQTANSTVTILLAWRACRRDLLLCVPPFGSM
jgi:hypothetical protein